MPVPIVCRAEKLNECVGNSAFAGSIRRTYFHTCSHIIMHIYTSLPRSQFQKAGKTPALAQAYI